jgi:hypothetical protein
MEFVKAQKNFERFMSERETAPKVAQEDERRMGGLLSPRGGMRRNILQNNSETTELDKVAGYVEQIRKHRMKGAARSGK